MSFTNVLTFGSLVGVIHFIVVGALYGNPLVDRLYKEAQAHHPAVRRWPSMPRYLATQFVGTQVEVFLLCAAFLWLRPMVGPTGVSTTLLLGALLGAVRVYPRFWNMWIQSTYPRKLLAIELVNGTLGTFAIVGSLAALS